MVVKGPGAIAKVNHIPLPEKRGHISGLCKRNTVPRGIIDHSIVIEFQPRS